jgi:hypothetical protein
VTYRIEITAETLAELAGKALALAAQFQTTVPETSKKVDPVMPELREVAERAPADPTPSEAVSSGETEASPTAPSGAEPEAPTTGEPLNFELDVAPVVLRAVSLKTKSFVQDVLSEFGSARASELDPARWPELIARLEAEMA